MIAKAWPAEKKRRRSRLESSASSPPSWEKREGTEDLFRKFTRVRPVKEGERKKKAKKELIHRVTHPR